MCQVWELLSSPYAAPSCLFSGLFEGCCLFSISPFVLLLDFPSFHLLCFLSLIFLLARLRSWHFFCSVLFLVLFPLPPLPHLSPPSFTSQWWPLGKAVPELSIPQPSNSCKLYYSPKHHFYLRTWAPSPSAAQSSPS